MDKAIEYLRVKGLAKAGQEGRPHRDRGLISAYIHGGRLGVLLETNCETDFVRGIRVPVLHKEVAMQIAAMNPSSCRRRDPFTLIERAAIRASRRRQRKPAPWSRNDRGADPEVDEGDMLLIRPGCATTRDHPRPPA